MDEVRIYMINSIVCASLVVFSVLMFLVTIDHLYLCFIASAIVGLYYASISVQEMKSAQDKITDITNSFIEVDEKTFVCMQTAGDVYETCCIYFDEVLSVTGITKRGRCGFYIQIKEGLHERSSVIQANNVITEENIFEVRGGLYDADQFIALYEYFSEHLPASAVIEKRSVTKKWYPMTKKKKTLFILMPWIIAGVFYGIQFTAVSVLRLWKI